MPTPFPDLYPSLEYFWEFEADQTVLDLANKSRQVNQHSPFDRRVFTLRYGMEDDHEMWEVLMPHFSANKAQIFPLFDFWRIPWPDPLHVATGNGSIRRFTLPAKETTGVVARVANAVRAATLFSGTGPDGADEIEFTPANTPATGAEIAFTASFARRRFLVWYFGGQNAPASIKPTPVEGGLWGADIQLIEDIGS
jgi:hypothetical protein